MKRVAVVAVLALLGALVVPAPASAVGTAPQPVVVGDHFVDSRTGATWVPHGVDVPSFEYACSQGWGYSNDQMTDASAAAMQRWGIDLVRLPLDETCWTGAPAYGTAAGYRAAVISWVATLHAHGIAVVLDLHWTRPPGAAHDEQYAAPSARSVEFWSQVAAAFAADPSVLFDLFNEPFSFPSDPLTPTCWIEGGCSMPAVDQHSAPTEGSPRYVVAGARELLAAVRSAGAAQPVLIAGLDYANDVRGIALPADGQLAMSVHVYEGNRCGDEVCWNAELAGLTVPVVATEFWVDPGDTDYLERWMAWCDAHGIGYLAWAWWVTDDPEYRLLTDADTFAPYGAAATVFAAHLASLGGLPAPAPVVTVRAVARPGKHVIRVVVRGIADASVRVRVLRHGHRIGAGRTVGSRVIVHVRSWRGRVEVRTRIAGVLYVSHLRLR